MRPGPPAAMSRPLSRNRSSRADWRAGSPRTEASRTDQAAIPPLPSPLPGITAPGLDPWLSPGTISAEPGQVVVVPVSVDTAPGLESVQLTIRYDEDRLDLVAARPAGLTSGFQYKAIKQGPGEVRIDLSGAATGTAALGGRPLEL